MSNHFSSKKKSAVTSSGGGVEFLEKTTQNPFFNTEGYCNHTVWNLRNNIAVVYFLQILLIFIGKVSIESALKF